MNAKSFSIFVVSINPKLPLRWPRRSVEASWTKLIRVLVTIASAATAFGIAMPAVAEPPQVIEVTALTTVNLGNPESSVGPFANSSFTHTSTSYFDTGAGTRSFSVNHPGAVSGITVHGLGASRVSPTFIPIEDIPQFPSVIVTSDTAGNGGWTFTYDGRSSSISGRSLLTRQSHPTFPYDSLHFFYETEWNSGLIIGGTYIAQVAIQGDVFNNSGYEHSPVTYGSGWFLEDDFKFKEDGFTWVTVETDNFQVGTGPFPNIDFTITAVPEPGALPLMAVGLLGLMGRLAVHRRAAALRA